MTITDPIADMLTRIRNIAMAQQSLVSMPSSHLKGGSRPHSSRRRLS